MVPHSSATTKAEQDPSKQPQVTFIGINYQPEPTGIGPYTSGMAEGLTSRGWVTRVITGYPHYPWWRVPAEYKTLPKREASTGVNLSRVRHFIPKRHNALTRALHEVTFGIRALFSRWGHPDIVVLVSPALLASSLVALRARLHRTPVVTWVQDIYSLGVKEAGSGAGAGIVSRIERQLAQNSRRVVVIHNRFQRTFVDALNVTAPIDVVRNWSHIPDLVAIATAETRASLGWNADDIIVLHAGNMGAKQGLENVVLASQLARDHGSRVRFVLMGDGNTRAELQAMGSNDHLQFIPPLPDHEFYAALTSADILLVNERPGLTEMSVPSKLTTYFATGLPVLAAVDESSTTYEEVNAAGAGPIVPAGDPAALLSAAEDLGADREQAQRMGLSGRRFREEHLSESAAIDSFERSLRKALSL